MIHSNLQIPNNAIVKGNYIFNQYQTIKEYICEKINVVMIYYKVQIYFLNDSNNCKT
jgi:hypothetical protein